MNNLNIFSKENKDLNKAILIAKHNKELYKVPNSCAFSEYEYFNHAYIYRKELLDCFRESYMVIVHRHKDIYIHETSFENVDKILNDGFLIGYDNDNSLGKGVYTFPLKSGRISALRDGSYYIVFTSNELHCHIVYTDNSNHELGEADFLIDKLKLIEPKVYSLNEMIKLSKNYFNPSNVLRNYYGIDDSVAVTYGNLCNVVSRYNT